MALADPRAAHYGVVIDQSDWSGVKFAHMSISRRKLISLFSMAPLAGAIAAFANKSHRRISGTAVFSQPVDGKPHGFVEVTNLRTPPAFREWLKVSGSGDSFGITHVDLEIENAENLEAWRPDRAYVSLKGTPAEAAAKLESLAKLIRKVFLVR